VSERGRAAKQYSGWGRTEEGAGVRAAMRGGDKAAAASMARRNGE
jgi:hypothetical protein